jgi:hypothetical protein
VCLRNVDGTLKASTLTFYTGHLENHIAPALGTHLVSGITRQDCRELIAKARAKGLKVATVRGIVRVTLAADLPDLVGRDVREAVKVEQVPGSHWPPHARAPGLDGRAPGSAQ